LQSMRSVLTFRIFSRNWTRADRDDRSSHLMATVHGYTSRKISRKVRDDADGVHASPGVSSSQILSVEASRASLYYLRAASHAMLGTTFW